MALCKAGLHSHRFRQLRLVLKDTKTLTLRDLRPQCLGLNSDRYGFDVYLRHMIL